MHCMLPSMHVFAVMLVLAEVLTVTHGLSSYVLSLAEGLAHAGMLLTCVVCGRLENAGLAIEVLPPYLQQGKAPHEPGFTHLGRDACMHACVPCCLLVTDLGTRVGPLGMHTVKGHSSGCSKHGAFCD